MRGVYGRVMVVDVSVSSSGRHGASVTHTAAVHTPPCPPSEASSSSTEEANSPRVFSSPGSARGGSPGSARGGSPGSARGGSPRGGSPGSHRGGSPGSAREVGVHASSSTDDAFSPSLPSVWGGVGGWRTPLSGRVAAEADKCGGKRQTSVQLSVRRVDNL